MSGGSGSVGGADVSSVVVNCAKDLFTVGGTVSGLSGNLVLQNNAADNTSNVTNVSVSCVSNTHNLGGTVTGLKAGMVLANNGGDLLQVMADGAFTFKTLIATGSIYSVTVKNQPVGQSCSVQNGVGVAPDADVTNIVVTCTDRLYKVSGVAIGLGGGSLVLQNNGGDNLTERERSVPLRDGTRQGQHVQGQRAHAAGQSHLLGEQRLRDHRLHERGERRRDLPADDPLRFGGPGSYPTSVGSPARSAHRSSLADQSPPSAPPRVWPSPGG